MSDDKQLKVIKELTAMNLPESDKVALLSAYMTPDSGVEILPGDKISIVSPGHYLLKRRDVTFQFKIVDGKKVLHGENSYISNIGSNVWRYYNNGNLVKMQYFDDADDERECAFLTTFYNSNGTFKEQTRDSFVGLPKGDKSNLKELSLEHFKKWLTKNILGAMNRGRNYLALYQYVVSDYKKQHLTWLENFVKCNNYKLIPTNTGDFRLEW